MPSQYHTYTYESFEIALIIHGCWNHGNSIVLFVEQRSFDITSQKDTLPIWCLIPFVLLRYPILREGHLTIPVA